MKVSFKILLKTTKMYIYVNKVGGVSLLLKQMSQLMGAVLYFCNIFCENILYCFKLDAIFIIA